MFFRSPSSGSANRLFRSASGYYYRIDEIVYYIEKQRFYPGIFCDFKNTCQDTHHTLNMFTVADLKQLLTYKEIFTAVRHHQAFMMLREWVIDIRERTLELMYALAAAAECLENLGIAMNSDLLSRIVSEPLIALYNHLNEDTPEAAHERQILAAITSSGGVLKTYSLGRTSNLMRDLHAFAHEQRCGAGFNRNLAGVCAAIKSCLLYQESMWQLIPNDAMKMRLFKNREHRGNNTYSQPMESIKRSRSNESSQESSLPPTQDMNDLSQTTQPDTADIPPAKRVRRIVTRA